MSSQPTARDAVGRAIFVSAWSGTSIPRDERGYAWDHLVSAWSGTSIPRDERG